MLCLFGTALLFSSVHGGREALAQRPFPVSDPFYRSETARHVFHDGVAVAAEVAYRSSALAPTDGVAASMSPLSVGFRVHYALTRQVDLNAFWDAASTSTGPTIMLSWVGLKYYWSIDHSDYAFRLAVDPGSDGRVGFPQLDMAFLSTKALTPSISTNFAIGLRRVRKGFREFVPAVVALDPEASIDDLMEVQARFIDVHAIGMELHFMWNVNTIFDPARSNLFATLKGEGGQYQLIQTDRLKSTSTSTGDDDTGQSDYRGGTLWLCSGIEFNRSSYQVIPFVGVPFKQWAPDGGRALMQVGFRFMLR